MVEILTRLRHHTAKLSPWSDENLRRGGDKNQPLSPVPWSLSLVLYEMTYYSHTSVRLQKRTIVFMYLPSPLLSVPTRITSTPYCQVSNEQKNYKKRNWSYKPTGDSLMGFLLNLSKCIFIDIFMDTHDNTYIYTYIYTFINLYINSLMSFFQPINP